MKRDQNGFGIIELLLVIIALTLVTGVGFYIFNANKDDSSVSKKSSVPAPAKQVESQQTQKTDEELIIAAVKAYPDNVITADTTIKVTDVQGINAQGTVLTPDDGGYGFIAHKTEGTWKVVSEGQEGPGKDVGEKYGLPASWYSTDY